jgi:hypothetical protein
MDSKQILGECKQDMFLIKAEFDEYQRLILSLTSIVNEESNYKAMKHLKKRYWFKDGKFNDVELLKFRSKMDKKSRNKLLDKLLDDSRPKKTQLTKQSQSMCETRYIYGEIRALKPRKSLLHSSLLEENTFFY